MDDIYFTKSGKNNDPPGSEINKNQKPEKKDNNIDIDSGRGKKKSPIKVLISILLVVVIIFLSSFGYIYNLMSKVNYNEAGHKDNVYVNDDALAFSSNVWNILFVGVDRRSSDLSSRSDTMLLLSIDSANKKIKMSSFLRDLWIDIPDSGYAKLNAACTYGGAQLVMDTIEYNFNIKIDNYALVDFEMFTDIIDMLGGVNVEVTEKESKYMSTKVFENGVPLSISHGENVHLDGTEALWYCRIRALDSDFMRTYRQRKVMTSIISKFKQTNIIELKNIAIDILPKIETDLSALTLTKLSFGTVFKYMRYEVEQAKIPADNTWKNGKKKGQSVLLADLDKNRLFLEDFLYSKDEKNGKNEGTSS